MASSRAVQHGLKQVKPILSTNSDEAKRRVLNLYKAWYRHIPYLVKDFDIPINVKQGREKLREQFLKNKHVTDIRTIDLLVIKGQMDLVETAGIWKQRPHIMMYFKDTVNPRPQGFLDKFYDGHDP